MSNRRNVGEAFRPSAGDLKVAPTSHIPERHDELFGQ
jgi:hypothetical protein